MNPVNRYFPVQIFDAPLTYKLKDCNPLQCLGEPCGWLHAGEKVGITNPQHSRRQLHSIGVILKNGVCTRLVKWKKNVSKENLAFLGYFTDACREYNQICAHGESCKLKNNRTYLKNLRKIAAKPKIREQIPDADMPMLLLKKALGEAKEMEPIDAEYLNTISHQLLRGHVAHLLK